MKRLLLAAVLVGCPILAQSADAPSPSPSPAPKVTLKPGEAEALVKEMSAEVERIRHLKFKTPVTMSLISGAEAREHFKSKIEPRDAEQLHYTEEVYQRLGLVPRGTSLLKNFLQLAEEGVDGYYEPGAKVFYLLDHVEPREIRYVMAHELTHALEDQHYDLQALSKLAGGDDDRSTGIAALIEGSAMVVMLVYMEQQKTKDLAKGATLKQTQSVEAKRAARLKEAPRFTQRSLMLPYLLGFSFLLRGHPWNFYSGGVLMSDLDYAFKHPPLSTRHVLHPELYWRRPDIQYTPPRLPDLSKQIGPGWTKAIEGSIGELGIATFTGVATDFDNPRILLPEVWTSALSAANIGDTYQLYTKDDRHVIVFVTSWENEQSAAAFARQLPPALTRRRYFAYGVNHLILMGDVEDAARAENLAVAALQGIGFWPHDEGAGKWPPDRGPEDYLE